MAKIGLFYGTQTGNTETIAEAIQSSLGGESVVAVMDICQASSEDLSSYEYLIIGCPTWNVGELQSDWESFYEEELDNVDFQGKKVAYFGVGDQIGYSDNFQDAMGILEEKITKLGGKTVGLWPTTGYDFDESKAVKNNQFVGLALDEDNQGDLTKERIEKWTSQLKLSFGI